MNLPYLISEQSTSFRPFSHCLCMNVALTVITRGSLSYFVQILLFKHRIFAWAPISNQQKPLELNFNLILIKRSLCSSTLLLRFKPEICSISKNRQFYLEKVFFFLYFDGKYIGTCLPCWPIVMPCQHNSWLFWFLFLNWIVGTSLVILLNLIWCVNATSNTNS